MSKRRRALIETFESRIMYSADPGPLGLAAAVLSGAEQQVADTGAAVQHGGSELVFIDARVPDVQSLLDDLAAQQRAGRAVEVVVVGADQDGIAVIGSTLAGRNDISAVHLIGHGSAGVAKLGSTQLDSESVFQRAAEISAWGDALTADADLLLYGCDIASTAKGIDFVNQLAQITGADVAASEDLTGAAALGGNWMLEYSSGAIDASPPISPNDQLDWQGILSSLTWNTFVGGSANDSVNGVAVDGAGNTYVTGTSAGTWGTPIRAFGGGTGDAFVAKFDSSGNLVWSTFLGGSGDDSGYAIELDTDGSVIITGSSNASWGTPQRAYGSNSDAFVAKLNSSGSLTWNTFLGSGADEHGYALAINNHNIVVTGDSNGVWGSPIRAYTTWIDVFAAQLDTNGALTWNTYLGGNGEDYAYGVTTDGSGNVYLTGKSSETWGSPVSSFVVGSYPDSNIATVKLNSSGALQWLTFSGGSGSDVGSGIALDASGNVYVAGTSSATWGSPIRAYTGDLDTVVVKFNSSGTSIWNTFLGGTGADTSGELSVSGTSVYVGGYSGASWGSSPWRAYSAGDDLYLAELTTGGALVSTGFLGGAGSDAHAVLATDSGNNVYVGGYSSATWGTPKRSYSALSDGVLTKVSVPAPAGITVTPTSGLTVTEAGGTAQFSVVLDSAPTANVTIGLSSSDTTEGTLSTSSLTFTTANWNVAQTVTVTGVDDTYIDGNVVFSVVTAAASSSDSAYNGLNASDVSLTNTDNDTVNTLVVDTASDTSDGTTTSIAALMANKGADGKISLRELYPNKEEIKRSIGPIFRGSILIGY